MAARLSIRDSDGRKVWGGKQTKLGLLLSLIERDTDDCLPLPGKKDKDGYVHVSFRGKYIGAHRLACWLVNGHPRGRLTRHSCDNPSCVNPKHLSFGTDADNVRDCQERGRRAMGEHMPHSKLTPELVRQIRNSSITDREWAERIGTTKNTVNAARNRQRWKHVA